jgi:hypothetical protein
MGITAIKDYNYPLWMFTLSDIDLSITDNLQ